MFWVNVRVDDCLFCLWGGVRLESRRDFKSRIYEGKVEIILRRILEVKIDLLFFWNFFDFFVGVI